MAKKTETSPKNKTLAAFKEHMRTGRFLTQEELAVPGTIQANGKWRHYTPLLADKGAKALHNGGALWRGLGLSEQQVRDETARIEELEEARITLQDELARFDRAILWRKNRLSDWLARLESSARAKLNDPAAAPDVQSLVVDAAGPLLALQDRYAEASTLQRRTSLDVKEQLAEERAARELVALENRVLRGEKLTVADVRPARERTRRKAPRKTRR